jgi:hypothetical protein
MEHNQHLVDTDNVNLLGENINMIKKNRNSIRSLEQINFREQVLPSSSGSSSFPSKNQNLNTWTIRILSFIRMSNLANYLNQRRCVRTKCREERSS